VLPGPVRRIHRGFDDPVGAASKAATEDDRLAAYRRTRDEIRAFVEGLPAMLQADVDRSPHPASGSDLASALALIEASGLPVAGVADAFPSGYALVRDGGDIVGVAGLETHGDVGLLRSVAVAPSRRGTGLGTLLAQDRLRAATDLGLRAVYLLTTTAADFFATLGFEKTTRTSAPEQLRGSSEFASVCPSTAVCLVKTLKGGSRR
jgi:N-acetylglutamate synthase-like GNAT family acetyltransferase